MIKNSATGGAGSKIPLQGVCAVKITPFAQKIGKTASFTGLTARSRSV